MKIMFSHFDEAVRSVAVHVEGGSSPIYLGPIEDPDLLAAVSRGGEDAIARAILDQQKWLDTLSKCAGVDERAAECAVRTHRNLGS
jgi:hypothetical protein